ncbi:MAG: hypothetical protein HC808_03550 [Candidatus Competibacteraceae bacterium]|nr:hypothetical protein [Candidatus Competibacteraceae bacterium]
MLEAFAAARGQEKLRDEIEQLLTQAEQYQTQLLQPPGDNAYETYQQVLTLDAENDRAQQGLARIIDTYQQQAEALRDQGQWQDSLAKIDEILQVFPDNAEMQSLRKRCKTPSMLLKTKRNCSKRSPNFWHRRNTIASKVN